MYSAGGRAAWSFTMSRTSLATAPRIAGTAIIRLNPTAQGRDSPSASPVAIVVPLRLTPGSGARVCARPISRACHHFVSAGPLAPSRRLSQAVRSRTDAVIRNPMPAIVIPSNDFLIHFMKNSASGTRGAVATAARMPTWTICGRRKPSGTSSAPGSPRSPVAISRR